MEIGDIISLSFKYPLSDTTAFFKVALLYVLLLIPFVLTGVGILIQNNGAIGISLILSLVCYIVFALILAGYHISVMKEGIDESGIIPSYDFVKNIIDSIKSWVLSFVYFIIPAIIIFALTLLVGISASALTSNQSQIFGASFAIVFIVSIILGIIFGMFALIGMLRFANTGSLSEGLSFSEVIEDLKGIGVGKVIVTWVIFGIIAGIILTIGAFLALIPVIGLIIYFIFILPYISLTLAYGFGLLYSEIA